jgi:hypothetical protein
VTVQNRPANWARMVIMLAAVVLAACAGPMKQQRLKPSEIRHPEIEQIVGLTTVKGENVTFDPAGGAYIDKSIEGKVKGADYRIALSEVERIWVMRRGISAARTTALVVGLAAATAVTVVAIEVAHDLAGNHGNFGCPIVYAWDGNQFIFDAELYGGAISRGLERPDYSELSSLRPDHGAYRLLLANELEETDFTDSLELWSVDHPSGTQVAADSDGRLYLMQDPRPPLAARDEDGKDLLPWLRASDRRIWEPPPAVLPEGRLRHELVMDFPRPAGAQSARLLVRAGTSPWGIGMLSRIFQLYGAGIDGRMEEVDRDPAQAQAVRDWGVREDLYTLRIWVEEPSGWQVRGILAGGGTTARVVPLDISHVQGDRLRIRVQPPAGFWAIDSFAVDYTASQPVQVSRIAPASARTQAGRSVARELRSADGVYYRAERGESAEIAFPAPAEKPGMSRTLILASKGYYRPTARSAGTADAAALFQIFMVPDGMARFSAQQYAAWRAAAGASN